jgi:alpha-glucosidase (family GH31 glycosyl hydrolase)
MDQVLDLGLDGFKCDASDPYVIEYFDWIGDSWTHYADMYYGDFWNYTRKVRGSDGLLMSRPVDCMPAGSGDFHFSFSPRYAVFSGWVGDQKGTFDGMKVALGNMFESARKKYVNFGSDTGGYLTDPTADKAFGRTKELFLRWTQLSAFCPLFENGGGGEHRPWMFDAETLQVYSHYVDVHYQLIPYLYSTGTAAYYGDRSAMTPMKDVELFYDGFEYLLGDNMLIAPITEANVTSLEVHFPPSKFAHSWVDFWKPTQTYEAGAKVTVDAPLGLVPVFVAAGSIIPMYDTSRAELDHVIVRIFAPTAEGRSFTVHSHGFEVSYTVAVDVLQVQLSERSKDDSVDKAFTVSVCIVGHNGTAERCSAEFDLSYGAVHAIM